MSDRLFPLIALRSTSGGSSSARVEKSSAWVEISAGVASSAWVELLIRVEDLF